MPSDTIAKLMAKHGVVPDAEPDQPPPSPAIVDAMSEFIGHVHKQDAAGAAECFQTMTELAGQGEQPQPGDIEPEPDEVMAGGA